MPTCRASASVPPGPHDPLQCVWSGGSLVWTWKPGIHMLACSLSPRGELLSCILAPILWGSLLLTELSLLSSWTTPVFSFERMLTCPPTPPYSQSPPSPHTPRAPGIVFSVNSSFEDKSPESTFCKHDCFLVGH